MARFFVALPFAVATEYDLPENVTRHLNVLRIRVNQIITLFNGNGRDYSAQVIELNKRSARVQVLQELTLATEASLEICLCLSIIASDKFDLVLQKAVELGVSQIIPVYSQNTQRFNSAKLPTRLEHWHKVIIAASEQCGRARLATLDAPRDFAELVNDSSDACGIKLLLSPHHQSKVDWGATRATGATHGDAHRDGAAHHHGVKLLIGPEGGFSSAEVNLAVAQGFQAVALGPRILRAETAAIVALSYIQTLIGDFSG